MKHASLAAAASLVLLANAFALIHSARNRSGAVEAEIALTSRELTYYSNPDDSGVDLTLRWTNPESGARLPGGNGIARELVNLPALKRLGFDCSVDPSDSRAQLFYDGQIPRPGYLALEYDGPASQAWVQSTSHAKFQSHLVAIDVDSEPTELRRRNPDRHQVVILPVEIGIYLVPRFQALNGRPAIPAKIAGTITEVPSAVHVPRPLADQFHGLSAFGGARSESVIYRVRLSYGKFLEPWVTGVEVVGQ